MPLHSDADRGQLTRYHCTGFDCKWWLYDEEFVDISHALQEAFLCHWSEMVQDALASNRIAGAARPQNWSQLGKVIRRHEKQMPKYKRQFVAPWLVRYKIASALGVDEHRLAPSHAQLIGLAAAILVENELPDIAIPEHYFYYYSSYALSCDRIHEVGWSFDRIRSVLATVYTGDVAAHIIGAARVAEAIGGLFHTSRKFQRIASEFTLRFAGENHAS